MCDDRCRPAADDSISFDDILDTVLEDRGEIIPFRPVGEAAQPATEKSIAAAGWHVQISFVAHNSDDPVIKVAAHNALNEPSGDNLRTLLRVVRSTPWYAAVQHVLADLAIAHADTVFAGN